MRKMSQLQKSEANKLLGYPADARLLIINADDFGMCHAINDAILRSLKEGVVCSTSLMAPCPWALHAMHLLRENPDIPFGVHLTVICDTVNYRWGPLTCRDKVPSLLDETGYFYSPERIPEFVAQAKLDELEVEFRAQIDAVLAANLTPTHLDWHCLRNGRRADIFDLTLRLAKERGLAVRVAERPLIDDVQRQGLPSADHDLLDSFRLETGDKAARYAQMLRDLPVGLSEWAVHPGLDNAELRTIQPDGAQVRQTDLDFMISAEAREVIQREGITLLSYKPLQEAWQERPSHRSSSVRRAEAGWPDPR
jgi:chitin disaccharide deacetylase